MATGCMFFICVKKVNVALNSEMELTETRFIDFSNTGFALSVDTTALLGNAQGEYLTFSFGRGDKAVQKLFCEVTGFSDTFKIPSKKPKNFYK